MSWWAHAWKTSRCPKRATEYVLRGTEPTEICSWNDAGRSGESGEQAALEAQRSEGESDRPRQRRRTRKGFWDGFFSR